MYVLLQVYVVAHFFVFVAARQQRAGTVVNAHVSALAVHGAHRHVAVLEGDGVGGFHILINGNRDIAGVADVDLAAFHGLAHQDVQVAFLGVDPRAAELIAVALRFHSGGAGVGEQFFSGPQVRLRFGQRGHAVVRFALGGGGFIRRGGQPGFPILDGGLLLFFGFKFRALEVDAFGLQLILRLQLFMQGFVSGGVGFVGCVVGVRRRLRGVGIRHSFGHSLQGLGQRDGLFQRDLRIGFRGLQAGKRLNDHFLSLGIVACLHSLFGLLGSRFRLGQPRGFVRLRRPVSALGADAALAGVVRLEGLGAEDRLVEFVQVHLRGDLFHTAHAQVRFGLGQLRGLFGDFSGARVDGLLAVYLGLLRPDLFFQDLLGFPVGFQGFAFLQFLLIQLQGREIGFQSGQLLAFALLGDFLFGENAEVILQSVAGRGAVADGLIGVRQRLPGRRQVIAYPVVAGGVQVRGVVYGGGVQTLLRKRGGVCLIALSEQGDLILQADFALAVFIGVSVHHTCGEQLFKHACADRFQDGLLLHVFDTAAGRQGGVRNERLEALAFAVLHGGFRRGNEIITVFRGHSFFDFLLVHSLIGSGKIGFHFFFAGGHKVHPGHGMLTVTVDGGDALQHPVAEALAFYRRGIGEAVDLAAKLRCEVHGVIPRAVVADDGEDLALAVKLLLFAGFVRVGIDHAFGVELAVHDFAGRVAQGLIRFVFHGAGGRCHSRNQVFLHRGEGFILHSFLCRREHVAAEFILDGILDLAVRHILVSRQHVRFHVHGVGQEVGPGHRAVVAVEGVAALQQPVGQVLLLEFGDHDGVVFFAVHVLHFAGDEQAVLLAVAQAVVFAVQDKLAVLRIIADGFVAPGHGAHGIAQDIGLERGEEQVPYALDAHGQFFGHVNVQVPLFRADIQARAQGNGGVVRGIDGRGIAVIGAVVVADHRPAHRAVGIEGVQHVDVLSGHDAEVGFFAADDVKQRIFVGRTQADVREVGKDVGHLHGLGAGGGEGRTVAEGVVPGPGFGFVADHQHVRHVDVVAHVIVRLVSQRGHRIGEIVIAQDVHAAFGGGYGGMAAVGNGEFTFGDAFILADSVQVVQDVDIAQGRNVQVAAVADDPVSQADQALGFILRAVAQSVHQAPGAAGDRHAGGLDVHIRVGEGGFQNGHMVAGVHVHVAVHRLEVQGIDVIVFRRAGHEDHAAVAGVDVQAHVFHGDFLFIRGIGMTEGIRVLGTGDGDRGAVGEVHGVDDQDALFGVREHAAGVRRPGLGFDVFGFRRHAERGSGRRDAVHQHALLGDDLQHAVFGQLHAFGAEYAVDGVILQDEGTGGGVQGAGAAHHLQVVAEDDILLHQRVHITVFDVPAVVAVVILARAVQAAVFADDLQAHGAGPDVSGCAVGHGNGAAL